MIEFDLTDEACGSFHGTTVRASVKELEKVLGKDHYSNWTNVWDKVHNEWDLEVTDTDEITDDCDSYIVTVYDWKEYRHYNKSEQIDWHLGSEVGADCEHKVKDEIERRLAELRSK